MQTKVIVMTKRIQRISRLPLKPEIQYPCQWYYKIIGADRQLIMDTIPTLFEHCDYHLSESNRSKTGKYTSFHFSLQVHSEEERNVIFTALKSMPTVKIVF